MKGSGSLSSANSDFEKAQSHSAAERKNEQTDSLYQQEKENVSAWQNLKDSFKRADDVHIADDLSGVDKVAVLTAQAPLNRSLKNRHLQMIAIGGAIGTGLFVGSGKALHDAGPAGILLGWILTSTMIMVVCLSLGELAVTFPVSGGYMTYVSRFVDESYAFGNNYNYMLQWLIVLPLEIVAAMITVYYWPVEKQYKAGFVTLFYLTIISINMFGVKGFGEAESIFSLVKVITVIGFIIMGIILAAGGGPSKESTGFKYWKDPGAFVGKNSHERFKSFSSVFVTAAFSFAGTELVGIAAAETAVPRKSVPKAAKQVFWRISIFYVASLFIVGLLVPSNDDRLLSESMVDAKASPFVLAAKNHGVHGIPAIMNVVILISVLSVGNSAVYTCSRVIASLASQGFLPDVCAYIDRKGRPLVGMAISSAAGLIAFICLSDAQSDAFDWMMAISGLSSLFTWFSICLSHIRFRLALKKRGRTIDELAYASPAGLWGSIYGALVIAMVLILQFWVAISPINTPPSAEIFFKKYISIFILFVMTGGHKLFSIIKRRKLYISLNDIDLDTGRREPDLEVFKQELLEERAILATKPLYYRIYNFWC